jgi:hypothetical protein
MTPLQMAVKALRDVYTLAKSQVSYKRTTKTAMVTTVGEKYFQTMHKKLSSFQTERFPKKKMHATIFSKVH